MKSGGDPVRAAIAFRADVQGDKKRASAATR
jgi:hypothetical protein